MKSLTIFSTLFFLAITSLTVSAADQQAITYKNQRGSTMTLTWHPDKNNTGTLTGTFTTAVGNCPMDMNKPMPLTGFYNGDAVSITVNFPNCKAVAAMAGTLTNNRTALNTLWLVTEQSKDAVHKDWNSNVIGSDAYKKIS